MAELVARARDLWTELAGSPVGFRDGSVRVSVSGDSSLCPPGWIGLVVLGGAGIAVVPDRSLSEAVGSLPVASATDPVFLRSVSGAPSSASSSPGSATGSPGSASGGGGSASGGGGSASGGGGSGGTFFPAFADVLGPATLAYLEGSAFRAAAVPGVERLPAGHPDLDALIAAAAPDDVAESGIDEIRSDAFVIRESGRVVAAAGYGRWLDTAAHLCVLTAAAARRRGLARVVASAAVEQALAEGLLPQWRAVPEPSRRIARALGFRELGSQLSVRPAG